MTQNGEPEMETIEHSEDYQKLVDYGINDKVAGELDKIYQSGLLCHADLDERALDALKEFPAEGGVQVLKQFADSNLEHVGNKSAYLCGVMKTYRQKNKMNAGSSGDGQQKRGPDDAKLKEILDRTGYSLDVTTGQRKYGGPPPGWEGNQPGSGHEVFVGKIPKDLFEDELIPLFENCGRIWDLRLMMDPLTGLNRGFAFVTFCETTGANEAVKQMDGYEIRKSRCLKVNLSVANLRLFVGNIPKSKSREEIEEEFKKITEDLTDVIIYSSPDDPKRKNRGFAFLEYDSHKSASLAKRRLGSGRIKVWGCDIIVDWADPIEEPDDETMEKVKVLYVRNLKNEVTEDQLKELFEPYGKIERVKKIKDYGFIHFEERESALKAMEEQNGKELSGINIDVSLAKPPSENRQKEKRKREQQQRFQRWDGWYDGYDPYWGPPMPPMAGGHRGGRGRMMRPSDYDYDQYSYGGYQEPFYDDYSYGDDYYSSRGARGRRGRGRGMSNGGRGTGTGRSASQGDGSFLSGYRGSRSGGMRGAAGRGRGMSGRGSRGAPGGSGAASGAIKRKMDGDYAPAMSKKPRGGGGMDKAGGWSTQPIAQQPLGANYDQQWYQDSYGSW